MDQLLSGAIAMGFCLAALFFFRFWRDTRDRLFALFGMAFLMMAANRIVIALSDHPSSGEEQYWVRFAAFVLILAAILDKNRPRGRRDRGPSSTP
jgi:uncharacterized membrane protein HdeD (DUF308 family)